MAPATTAATIFEELSSIQPGMIDKDPQARRNALILSRKLTAELKGPTNAAVDMMFAPFIPSALLRDSKSPLSTAKLAELTGGDALLLNWILRLLPSINFVEELGPDLWSTTPITKAMANPNIAAGHRFVWDTMVEANVKYHHFLKETGFKLPVEPTDHVIQFAHGKKYSTFDYLAKLRPDRFADFHLFMGNTMGARNYWVDWYPARERLLDGSDSSSGALQVDVGGGKGHDLQAFISKFPETEGKLVLQDLPEALASIKDGTLSPRIRQQGQDFFAPNKEAGARTYFMHHILHDWSDKYALKILEPIVKVMKRGYSKLLIHDLVLPDAGITSYQARFDMAMRTFNAGMERSRSQWQSLLGAAGLEVVQFWHGPDGEDADGIVEAALKE
ncbi:hypothetical protein M409DRAFT_69702 [Zasmidium cellare ATCC 36951]|uniref:O-methyltransferase C-terminal domain-containing protein n=1 Tax=Zasmidium cellare ATCC 36951 TaxID=1080233 RepID=A0A6A6C3B0_ZASCE|nr:uncharacterized protein M409DRAFT_69702 [Zasmidium cellare ATCC 36951]KAF2161627.1 hypothetical protein M409DRAFT_69702 [Zasmidium cellare ATCC 36951]